MIKTALLFLIALSVADVTSAATLKATKKDGGSIGNLPTNECYDKAVKRTVKMLKNASKNSNEGTLGEYEKDVLVAMYTLEDLMNQCNPDW